MSQHKSYFFDEWRDCLHSHYLYVVQTADTITEPTLREVLMDAGVSQDAIEAWRREALQRAGLPIPEDDLIETTAIDEEPPGTYPGADEANSPAELVSTEAVALHEVDAVPQEDDGQELDEAPPVDDIDDLTEGSNTDDGTGDDNDNAGLVYSQQGLFDF
jgi:hypothetical protein